jgi:hypothetical protein
VTEPTDFDQADATLPGLDPAPRGNVSAGNEAAARRTLAALSRGGLYGEQQAVIGEALLTCARQLDRAASSPRAKDYGVAALLAQLDDLYERLTPDDMTGGGSGDAFDQLAADLRAAAMGHGLDGRGTAVRDAAQSEPTD